jgi:hypothetical protein
MLSTEIITAIAAGIATIMGANFALIKWIITKFLHELKPNGGTSLKDQVNRLEKRVDDMYQILAELNAKKTRTKK